MTEKAILLNQDVTEPHYLAAEIHVNQGNFDEAKKDLSAVLRLNPLSAPAHYLFGCIFIEKEMFEKAKESLRKALYIDKNFSLAHFYLGHLYKTEEKGGQFCNAAFRDDRSGRPHSANMRCYGWLDHQAGREGHTLLAVEVGES